MKFSRISYTVVATLSFAAILIACSSVAPTKASPCEYCDFGDSTGIILAQHTPNKFVTHTASTCDLTVPAGSCSWLERMVIRFWSPQFQRWILQLDATEHVFGQCGGTINYHSREYGVGTGHYQATLEVKNNYGTVIDSYVYDLTF